MRRHRAGLSGPVMIEKTHCPKGHLYDEENTYFTTKGHRHCRKCAKENFSKIQRRRSREDKIRRENMKVIHPLTKINSD